MCQSVPQPRHRQQREPGQRVQLDQRELAERGEDEARDRDPEDHQEHDRPVGQPVARTARSARPEGDRRRAAAKTTASMPSVAETGKWSRMMSFTVRFCWVNEMPKSPRRAVAEIDQVLAPARAGRGRTWLEVRRGCRRGSWPCRSSADLPGHGVHGDERGGRDEPHGDQPCSEPPQRVAHTCAALELLLQDPGVGEVRVGTDRRGEPVLCSRGSSTYTWPRSYSAGSPVLEQRSAGSRRTPPFARRGPASPARLRTWRVELGALVAAAVVHVPGAKRSPKVSGSPKSGPQPGQHDVELAGCPSWRAAA